MTAQLRKFGFRLCQNWRQEKTWVRNIGRFRYAVVEKRGTHLRLLKTDEYGFEMQIMYSGNIVKRLFRAIGKHQCYWKEIRK